MRYGTILFSFVRGRVRGNRGDLQPTEEIFHERLSLMSLSASLPWPAFSLHLF
jgi:hypothetical protein